jgi:hypothetical protein
LNFFDNLPKTKEMGEVFRMCEECIGAHTFLVGKPEGRRPFASFGCKWNNNVKIYLQETEWETLIGIICLGTGRSCGSCE